MIFLFRVNVLSLLVGSVLSLNHGNFIGDGNGDAGTSDILSAEEFFRFNAALYPVSPPPSQRPTPSPTVFSPTSPPIPAGRFPSPVSKPTLEPGTAPVSGGRWSPTSNNIQRSPPTFARNPGSNKGPPVTAAQQKVETRIASYKAEWGSDVQNCQDASPSVFFNCHDGGKIGLKSSENAKCTRVRDDRVQCAQNQIDSDSLIEFTCSGIRKNHLMSTAMTSSNLVTNCKKDGNIVEYLTMSRKCTEFEDTTPKCNRGITWNQGDVAYCASPKMCSGQTYCSELNLEPLAMSNTNIDLRCSRVDPDQDLQFRSFDKSYLSSISSIDWRISGKKRGCSWDPSPLLLRCEDGGRLEFEEDYKFCSIEDNTGQCKSIAPEESERTISLSVKCIGESESQLTLSVEMPPTNNKNTECVFEGTIIQSVMLSRKCREPGSAEFNLVNNMSFCDDEEQIYEVDDNQTHCFVGSTCSSDDGCGNMQLPHLVANTGSGSMEHCTYIV